MTSRIAPAPVLILALAVPLLGMLATLQGWYGQHPPERIFLGFRYMSGDHYQYASFMRQAQQDGRFLMENRYTTEPQKGVYVFPFFWLLGSVARLTGATLPAVWELFRLTGGFLLILVFWHFTSRFFEQTRQRLLATFVFSLAGGLDWIVALLRLAGLRAVAPLEEAFDNYWNWCTFGALLLPNWIWPLLLWMLLCLCILMWPRWRSAALLILPPMIWFIHHYTAVVVYLALVLFPLATLVVAGAKLQPLPWRRFRSNLAIVAPGLASFAVVAVYLWWARADVVFRLNAATTFDWKLFYSPWWYPLSYGLLIPLAWFGLKEITGKESLDRDLLLAWLMAAFFLSMNPISAGVKYQYLMYPPLAILAVRGIYHALRQSEGLRRLRRSHAARAAFWLALFLNAPVSLVKDLPEEKRDQATYYEAAEIEALKWLGGQPDGSVLASYRTGRLVPWLSDKKTYVGHWFMTLDVNRKLAEVNVVFSAARPLPERRDLIRKTGARYVILGPQERLLGGVDETFGHLKVVYDRPGVRIFETPF